MVSFNLCTFIGNAGADAELRTTEEGTSVVKFRLAVATDFKKESQDPPLWLTVIAFGKLATQVSEIVKKGSLTLVSGRLAVREYTDKNNVLKQSTEVIAQNIQVLSGSSRAKAEKEPIAESVMN